MANVYEGVAQCLRNYPVTLKSEAGLKNAVYILALQLDQANARIAALEEALGSHAPEPVLADHPQNLPGAHPDLSGIRLRLGD